MAEGGAGPRMLTPTLFAGVYLYGGTFYWKKCTALAYKNNTDFDFYVGWTARNDRPDLVDKLFTVREPRRKLRNSQGREREIETLLELDHGNVVRLEGYGPDDSRNGHIFFTSYFPLGTLLDFYQTYCKERQHAPSQALSLKLSGDILRGVKYLHDRGIVHCNIGHASVTVDCSQSNGMFVAKLTDILFGKVLSLGNAPGTTVTNSYGAENSKMQSPQRFADVTDFDTKDDIFAAGLLMLGMITFSVGKRSLTPVGKYNTALGQIYLNVSQGEVENYLAKFFARYACEPNHWSNDVKNNIIRRMVCYKREERLDANETNTMINQVLRHVSVPSANPTGLQASLEKYRQHFIEATRAHQDYLEVNPPAPGQHLTDRYRPHHQVSDEADEEQRGQATANEPRGQPWSLPQVRSDTRAAPNTDRSSGPPNTDRSSEPPNTDRSAGPPSIDRSSGPSSCPPQGPSGRPPSSPAGSSLPPIPNQTSLSYREAMALPTDRLLKEWQRMGSRLNRAKADGSILIEERKEDAEVIMRNEQGIINIDRLRRTRTDFPRFLRVRVIDDTRQFKNVMEQANIWNERTVGQAAGLIGYVDMVDNEGHIIVCFGCDAWYYFPREALCRMTDVPPSDIFRVSDLVVITDSYETLYALGRAARDRGEEVTPAKEIRSKDLLAQLVEVVSVHAEGRVIGVKMVRSGGDDDVIVYIPAGALTLILSKDDVGRAFARFPRSS